MRASERSSTCPRGRSRSTVPSLYGRRRSTRSPRCSRPADSAVRRSFRATALPRGRSWSPAASGWRGRGGPRTPRQGAKELVGCGRPDPEHRVVIADPSGEPVADGQEGEICVSGPSVAAGYWPDGAFGTLLRTGDLGLLADGELYVTGRIKELVIVAGRNHHALDIELACERAVAQLRRGC